MKHNHQENQKLSVAASLKGSCYAVGDFPGDGVKENALSLKGLIAHLK